MSVRHIDGCMQNRYPQSTFSARLEFPDHIEALRIDSRPFPGPLSYVNNVVLLLHAVENVGALSAQRSLEAKMSEDEKREERIEECELAWEEL